MKKAVHQESVLTYRSFVFAGCGNFWLTLDIITIRLHMIPLPRADFSFHRIQMYIDIQIIP